MVLMMYGRIDNQVDHRWKSISAKLMLITLSVIINTKIVSYIVLNRFLISKLCRHFHGIITYIHLILYQIPSFKILIIYILADICFYW